MKTTKRRSRPDRAKPPRDLLAGKMEHGRLVEVTGKLAWPLDEHGRIRAEEITDEMTLVQ